MRVAPAGNIRGLAFSPRATVVPSATAPAAGLLPSMPSVPALSTAIGWPAIFAAHASTNVALRPPIPLPVTGELTSPSASSATRLPGFAWRKSASCRSKKSAALSTGQSSVEFSAARHAAVSFCGFVRGMEKVVHAEHQEKVRIGKRRVAFLRRFRHLLFRKPPRHKFGKCAARLYFLTMR